eukprot:scaffold178056_cov16-Tisochrysis_lutea.AAC.1
MQGWLDHHHGSYQHDLEIAAVVEVSVKARLTHEKCDEDIGMAIRPIEMLWPQERHYGLCAARLQLTKLALL